MNRQLLTILAGLMLLANQAAEAQHWQWGKRGGAMFNSTGTGPNDQISDMAVDQNGNVYFVGICPPDSPDFDGHPLKNYRGAGVFVVSTTCNGMYRWSKMIGGGSHVPYRPCFIGVDSFGHVYAAMTTNNYPAPDNIHFDTDSTQPSNSIKHITLIQYDTSGNFRWLRQPDPDTMTIFGTGVSQSLAIHAEKNGDVYWLVQLSPGLVSGGGGWVVSGSPTYILKYDRNGNMTDHVLMDMQTKGVFFNFFGLNRTRSGKFVISGTQQIGTGTGTFSLGGAAVNHDAFLACFNPQGRLLWKKESSTNSLATMILSGPAIDGNNCIYYGGSSVANVQFNGYTFTYRPSYSQMAPFVGKADSNGNHIWTVNANSKGQSKGECVLKSDNEIWLSGFTGSMYWDSTHDFQKAMNSGIDGFAVRFNSAGHILSLDTLAGAWGSKIYPECNAIDPQGNLLIGGRFNININIAGANLINNGGDYDFFVAKFGFPCNCAGQQPVAAHSFTPQSLGAVQFRYTGTMSIDSLVWTFGDGSRQTVKSGFGSPVSHTYKANGSYMACANVYAQCGTDASCKQFTVTNAVGVQSAGLLQGVKVYPNPAAGILHIEGAEGGRAMLSGISGQALLSLSIQSPLQTIDISALAPGLYVLVITDAQGNRGAVKVVKE